MPFNKRYIRRKLLKMAKNRLDSLFSVSSSEFPNNECIYFISKVSRSVFTYNQISTFVDVIFDCLQLLNLKNDEFIAIALDSLYPEVIAVMIAVLKSNAAFVFLDVANHECMNIIHSLSIRYIIFCDRGIPKFHLLGENITHLQDLDLKTCIFHRKLKIFKVKANEKHEIFHDSTISSFAFAVFSSGTTGNAKIIRVPHRCILPNVNDLRSIYKLETMDKILISTTPTFDPCILDIFLGLSSGSCLVTVDNDVKFDQNILVEIFTNTVTILYTTPSLFLRTFPKFLCNSSLRILTLGGESFPEINVEEYPFLKSISVYNIYGITEVSCWASISLVTCFKSHNKLGNPLSETSFEIRNDNGIVIQEGVGELFVGSETRVCSVSNRTKEETSSTCYRSTGDFVKVENDEYMFIGRKDRIIKLFGHQIDLTLIEQHALLDPDVKFCFCFFAKSENKIILLVESFSENLEKFLKLKLPPYIIPNIYLTDEIPLNTHGKICERSCRKLYESLRPSEYTDFSSIFKNLWLKYTTAKSSDACALGYIAAGGDSMLALQFTTALSNIIEVPNEFVVALLSNCDFGYCLSSIYKNSTVKNSYQLSNKRLETKIKNDENEDVQGGELGPVSKKTRTNRGQLREIRCKGIQESFLETNDVQIRKFSNIKLKWKHDTSKCVDSSPTLLIFEQDAIVICGSHSGKLFIVDVKTGELLSQLMLPDRIETSVCASPCGKYFFLGCYDCNLYCIEIDEGIIKWNFTTNGIIKCKPVFHEQKVYFGSYDHHLYCLSSNGHLLWKINIDKSSIYASILILDDIIVVATLGGTIAILNFDGLIVSKICHDKPFFSSPCKISSDLFLSIDVTGMMRLHSKISRSQLWENQVTGNVFSSVSVIQSKTSLRIVFGSYDNCVHCFDITERAAILCWKISLEAAIYATPFSHKFHDSHDFQESAEYFTLVLTINGGIYCINVSNGQILLSYSIHEAVFSSPVLFGNRFIFGCRNNNLYCFELE